jgi:ESCRT-II complex subunit VPS36
MGAYLASRSVLRDVSYPLRYPYRNQKAPNHQNGSIHLTSHRLIYVDSPHPRKRSLTFALSDIHQSEYYAGFLTSSPKITLALSSPIQPSDSADVRPGAGEAASGAGGSGDTSFTRWECEICGNKNVDAGLAPKMICQLCGVPRSSKSSAVAITGLSKVSASASTPALSQSLPVSTPPNVLRDPSTPPNETNDDDENGVACPACTFINHPSLRNCELCNTPLPKRTRIPNKSAPSSRPPSPTLEDHTPIGGDALIKVSFRGGGDRAFHAALKRVLIAKPWVVDVLTTKAAPAGGSKSGIRTFFTESPLTYPS